MSHMFWATLLEGSLLKKDREIAVGITLRRWDFDACSS